MSTRGTYQFENLTFYIHHDNYLEGAARYFYKMVEASIKINTSPDALHPIDDHNTRGGMEFAFIRGIGNADLSKGHDHHSDTEFRYFLNTSDLGVVTINAQEKMWTEIEGDKVHWRVVYNGELSEFINKYAEVDADKVLCKVDDYSNRCTYATFVQAHDAAIAFYEGALKFNEGNPNRLSYMRKGKAWSEVISLRQDMSKIAEAV